MDSTKNKKNSVVKMITMNNESEPVVSTASSTYVLYHRRWYMLFVVVMFNVSNAAIWITFAPVTNYSAVYFGVPETKINWCSLVFFVAFIPCCGVSWWVLERWGFRFSVILGTLLNGLGGAIRVVGIYVCETPSSRFTIVLIGQTLSACTQPLVLSMPTKIAALWFGDHERTVATTIASLANPVGVAVANGIAAGLVKSSQDIQMMLVIFAVPGVMAFLLALLGFTSSIPPTPPSASAIVKPVSFFVGIKEALQNKSFLILLFASGFGIGSFSFLSSVVQQFICLKGYGDSIAGIAGSMIITGGLLGSAVCGVFIDRTRRYIETSKILLILFALASCSVSLVTYSRDNTVLLVLAYTVYGTFGLGGLPTLLELGVECTFPVDEATSSGLQWMCGQGLGAAMMLGGLALAPPLTPDEIKHSKCAVGGATQPVNLTYPILIVFCISLVPGVMYVSCFDTPYKRLNAELESVNGAVIENGNADNGSSSSSIDEPIINDAC